MKLNCPDDWQSLFDELPLNLAVDKQQTRTLKKQVVLDYDDHTKSGLWKKQLLTIGHYLVTKRTPRFAAITVGVMVATWFFVSFGNRSAFAVQEMLDAILESRNVSFVTTMRMEGQPPIELKGCYSKPGKMRQEMGFGKVTIMDFESDKIVMLDENFKTAYVINLIDVTDEIRMQMRENAFTELQSTVREAQQDPNSSIEKLGESEIDGRTLLGYRLGKSENPMTIWADPETHQPYLVETSMAGPPASIITISNFEFDKDLDDSLFSVEVPEGYKSVESTLSYSLPPEDTLVTTLKMFSEAFDGNFPDTISLKMVTDYQWDGTLKFAEEIRKLKALQRQMPDLVPKESFKRSVEKSSERNKTFIPGFKFVSLLPNESLAHYAGKGVVFDEESDQPIFWYKPENRDTWRVLGADLKFRDAPSAPDIQDAIPMKKTR